jgi:hypothetical protein
LKNAIFSSLGCAFVHRVTAHGVARASFCRKIVMGCIIMQFNAWKNIVEKFGPINKVEIVIKAINVYIGDASNGKGIVAKLITIFIGCI